MTLTLCLLGIPCPGKLHDPAWVPPPKAVHAHNQVKVPLLYTCGPAPVAAWVAVR